MNKEMEFIAKIAENVERSWTSYSAYLSQIKMKDVLKLIKNWYPSREEVPTDLREILKGYQKLGTVDTQISYGYMYYLDEIEKFLKDPDSLWDSYDNNICTKYIMEEPYVKYSTDRQKNTRMFFSEIFYNLVQNMEFYQTSYLSERDRKVISNYVAGIMRDVVRNKYIGLAKFELIEALKSVIEMLEKLGAIETMKFDNNSQAQRLGLDFFKIAEDIPSIEDGKLFGIEFEQCSIFQLEALLCHYFNRLEKVRESIGKGLFFLCYLCDLPDVFKTNVRRFSSEKLLECQKEYVVMFCIQQNMLEEVYELFEKSEINNMPEPNFENIYNETIDKYFRAYVEYFKLVDKGNEDTPEARKEFTIRLNTLSITNAYYKHFNYITKISLFEDLIIQAERNNINWGVMPDGAEGYRIKRNMLIGFDIPGLNMPLRLHFPLIAIKQVVHNYLGLDEIPLYVGREDFDILDKPVGTQFILPLNFENRREIKNLAQLDYREDGTVFGNAVEKYPKITSDAVRRIKHINYMQLPNTAKRLLSEKTRKTQEFPDYMNIFTGKIRKTPRRGS